MAALQLPWLFHIGWVVGDCEAAQHELADRLGAGPFVGRAPEARSIQAVFRGRDAPLSLKVVFGLLGGVIIELLQPLDDRSPHAEFLAERGEGLHHLAYLVDDFDEQVRAATSADPPYELLVDGTSPANRVRWAYLEGGAARGTVIELLERSPASDAVFGDVLRLLGR